MGPKKNTPVADAMVAEYNARLQKLASEKEFSHKQFNVVYQPGFTAFPIAKYKQSFLSGFDW